MSARTKRYLKGHFLHFKVGFCQKRNLNTYSRAPLISRGVPTPTAPLLLKTTFVFKTHVSESHMPRYADIATFSPVFQVGFSKFYT